MVKRFVSVYAAEVSLIAKARNNETNETRFHIIVDE